MPAILFLILCLVLVCHASSLWFFNNGSKPKSALQIPAGLLPAVGKSITKGAEMALEYCQNVFKWNKWNCPSSSFFRLSKHQPTKEAAFSKAILAAGIVHSITKDCSNGLISECGCDPNLGPPSVVTSSNRSNLNESLLLNNVSREVKHRSSDWTWGGCSDDPRYALDVAKKFLDDLESGNGAAGYVGRHNYKVGREMIRESMIRKCRCHGVSGSCTMQTCWMQVISFGEVVKKLRGKYKKAERLAFEAVQGNSAREFSHEKVVLVKRSGLVYLVQSPDYCIKNFTEGLVGTKGRKCSRPSTESAPVDEMKSCRTLCKECGYKVKKITKEVTKKCNCKFVWCCEVKCETCEVDVDEYFCY